MRVLYHMKGPSYTLRESGTTGLSDNWSRCHDLVRQLVNQSVIILVSCDKPLDPSFENLDLSLCSGWCRRCRKRKGIPQPACTARTTAHRTAAIEDDGAGRSKERGYTRSRRVEGVGRQIEAALQSVSLRRCKKRTTSGVRHLAAGSRWHDASRRLRSGQTVERLLAGSYCWRRCRSLP